MFKKSLIALSLAAIAGSAAAADLSTTEYNAVSKEGANPNTPVIISDHAAQGTETGVVVALGADYSVGDIVTLTFTGIELDDTSAPVAAYSTAADVTFGLLNQTANSLTFRITDIANAPDTTTGTLTVKGLKFDTASLLESGAASVTYAAETSTGVPLDSAKTNTRSLFKVVNQFTAKVEAPFAEVIDVNSHRKAFVNGNTTTTEAVIKVVAAETANYDPLDTAEATDLTLVQAVAYDATNIVVHGDFAFLGEADDKGQIDETDIVDASPNLVANSLKLFEDRIEASVSALGTTTITVDVVGEKPGLADNALATQSFTASLTLVDTSEDEYGMFDKAAAGSWTLNGAVIHVPFMPFRTGFAPIVNISNTSSQAGDIEVQPYYEDGRAADPIKLSVQAAAKAQTNITAALKASGIEGDVAMDIIVNAPKSAIEVNALYFEGGDRAVINTVKQP